MKALGSGIVWIVGLALIASGPAALAWPTLVALAVVGVVMWARKRRTLAALENPTNR